MLLFVWMVVSYSGGVVEVVVVGWLHFDTCSAVEKGETEMVVEVVTEDSPEPDVPARK